MARTTYHVGLTVATYVSLLGALLCTVILMCGCIPTTSGQTSALKSFYALKLNVPGPSIHAINIASFALCADYEGAISCATTAGKDVGGLSPMLYGPLDPIMATEPVDTALKLQHKVFFGTPILATFFLVCTLTLALFSHCFGNPCPRFLKITAALMAALATTVMLVDAFSTKLVFSALEISNDEGFTYEHGKYWIALQWMGFAFGLLATGALFLSAFRGEEGDKVVLVQPAAVTHALLPVREDRRP